MPGNATPATPLSPLLAVLRADEAFASAVDVPPAALTAPTSAVPALLAAGPDRGVPTVVITATGADASDLAEALAAYVDRDTIARFPSWETLPHERLSPRADTVAERIATLRRVAHPEEVAEVTGLPPARFVIAPVRAVLQPVIPGLADLEPVAVRKGEMRDLSALVAALAEAAYERVDMVERRGQFAVRGGIVDVFAPTDPHPTRIEFFGDEVDSLRAFSVADQRSLEERDTLWAPPCREMVLTDEVRSRAATLIDDLPGVADMLTAIAEGNRVDGMESLIPLLVGGLAPVTASFPEGTSFVAVEPERIKRRAEDVARTVEEFRSAAWVGATAGGKAPVEAGEALLDLERVRDAARILGSWREIGPFGGLDGADAGLASAPEFRGDVGGAAAELRSRVADGWRVVVTTAGAGGAERIVEQFGDADLAARVATTAEAQADVVTVTPHVTGAGYASKAARLLVIGEAELTGRSGRAAGPKTAIASRRRNVVDPLQLRPGDFVVHDQHGVGKFIELSTRSVRGVEREYMVIEYAPSKRGAPADRLSVPTDQLDQITKYSGGETPAVNKMGGSDWAKAKGRARKAVKEIAAELIRLYSARMATSGHAFGPDTPWQRELEEAFAYVETPDQLVTIDDVKADMEKGVPMDRLVCGDVGFGKTEIAVRAAFKAIQDGTQVALLCPTTLLVKQHLETFSDRMAQFPVNVKALSRFQTDKEAKEIIEGLADGSVDMVIGTHRLLTGSVRFKRLGLVIIDEEQRFGVEHKDTLKALRTDVDVLALSATPIPRTLEMAVTGIREMSTLATPPEERHPVLTYVGPQENAQVAAAVRRELLRDGQVFYIHNAVKTIDRAAKQLGELVPEARIGVAHGQMSERELERVIVDYYERRYDVLVCTTIVETGLDIPNANTLVVERADRFGLSQLHQLRGRVGRARERAYAYFLYPQDQSLTETAHERLQTIAAHTDLGAGMQVAMKDLEIRGAGNLLGAEQSGHIEGVGFDLYIRMVGEAVASFRGEGGEERSPVTIDVGVDAHLPSEYIEHERLRLEAYRKIATAATHDQLEAVREELRDRYGEVPPEGAALFDVAALRVDLAPTGITDVVTQGRQIRFSPVELADSAAMRVNRIYPGTIIKPALRQILVPAPTTARIGGSPLTGSDMLAWVRETVSVVTGQPVGAPEPARAG